MKKHKGTRAKYVGAIPCRGWWPRPRLPRSQTGGAGTRVWSQDRILSPIGKDWRPTWRPRDSEQNSTGQNSFAAEVAAQYRALGLTPRAFYRWKKLGLNGQSVQPFLTKLRAKKSAHLFCSFQVWNQSFGRQRSSIPCPIDALLNPGSWMSLQVSFSSLPKPTLGLRLSECSFVSSNNCGSFLSFWSSLPILAEVSLWFLFVFCFLCDTLDFYEGFFVFLFLSKLKFWFLSLCFLSL